MTKSCNTDKLELSKTYKIWNYLMRELALFVWPKLLPMWMFLLRVILSISRKRSQRPMRTAFRNNLSSNCDFRLAARDVITASLCKYWLHIASALQGGRHWRYCNLELSLYLQFLFQRKITWMVVKRMELPGFIKLIVLFRTVKTK